jgi:hypothetical protein
MKVIVVVVVVMMMMMKLISTTSLLYVSFVSVVIVIILFGKVTYTPHEDNCEAIIIQKREWSTNKTDKYQ